MDKQSADILAESLRRASQDYYSTGVSDMSDAEYDDGIRILSREYPNDYTDLYDTSVANNVDVDADDDVVIHDLPMMSLAKAYTIDDVKKYVDKLTAKGATGFRFQPKLDGMSCSALYRHGKLEVISSRGNGTEGRDMSYLIGNHDVSIRHMPDSIDDSTRTVEVRGELLLTYSDYDEASNERSMKTGEHFKSYRNANAGIANGARLGLGYHANLTFIAYRLIIDGTPHDDDKDISSLNSKGFLTSDEALAQAWTHAPRLVVKSSEPFSVIANIIEEYGNVKDDFNIPNDGIVIKPMNEDAMDTIMGSTAHHPSSQLAFKYVGERITVDVSGIEWSVGKQGHLTPTLLYAPKKLGKTVNDRATFHNASYVKEYDIAPGSQVIIEWAGEVIPKFIDVVSTPDDAERFTVPKTCPSCSGAITMKGRIASCENTSCPSRIYYILKAAVSRGNLDIKSMGESILKACIHDDMLTDVPSLFLLDERSLADLHQGSGRVVGEKTAKTIMNHIEKAKTLPFERVVSSLAIQGLGVRKAGFLKKNGITTISKLASMTADELMDINHIGSENAKDINDWFDSHPDICERLSAAGVQCVDNGDEDNEYDERLKGMSFSITGAVPDGLGNRNAFIEYIESHGASFNSSPNSRTSYMVGDMESSSSKMKKAIKLGIPVITPDDFHDMFMKTIQ